MRTGHHDEINKIEQMRRADQRAKLRDFLKQTQSVKPPTKQTRPGKFAHIPVMRGRANIRSLGGHH
jgi:hypothetical protein